MEHPQVNNNRRAFLKKTFSSCTLCCLGGAGTMATAASPPAVPSRQIHKFKMDAGMTMEQVFGVAYQKDYIPTMKMMMRQMGKRKFLRMLKKTSEMRFTPGANPEVEQGNTSMKEFVALIKGMAEGPAKLIQTAEFTEESDQVFEMKITECLWANTFREADAAEIGYAGICHQDYAWTKSLNPNLTLYREKTLMEGDDCCISRWVMEA
jgi:hypothetical protein